MIELNWISGARLDALGWMLLHFVWQGFAVASVLAVTRSFIKTPRLRYWTASIALLSMVALAVFTFVSRDAGTHAHIVTTLPALTEASSATELLAPIIDPVSANRPLSISTTPDLWLTLTSGLQTWSREIVIGWLVGVLLLTVRLLGGCLVCLRLKRTGTRPLPEAWQTRVESLTARLNVSRPVTVVTSAIATVPMVVGIFKPVILIPVSTLLCLAPDQLEAILIHELAHIRRYDNLVNLLQRIVETVFFFHPAIWWVSGCIRTEREHCCDDTAALASSPKRYARALAELAEHRRPQLALAGTDLAVAATDGSLVSRVRRLLSLEQTGSSVHRSTHTFSNLLGIIVVLVVAAALLETSLVADPLKGQDMSSESRKVLDIKPSKAFTRAVNGLHPMLLAAGETNWSPERLHAVLGTSFTYAMRKGGGKVWQEANLEWWNSLPALDLGIPVRRIEGKESPDLLATKEAAWDAVRAQIDQGIPVAAFCPMSSKPGGAHDWGLIVGYDTSDKTYTVRRRHEDFQVKFDKLGQTKPGGRFCVLIYDPTKQADSAGVDTEALRNAVAFANGTRFTPDGYSYPVDANGFAALKLWHDDILAETPIPAEQGSLRSGGFFADSHYNSEELRNSRRYCANYLREIASVYTTASSNLEKAASHYNRVSAAAKQLGLVFHRAKGTDTLSKADRAEAAGLIATALQEERSAIASIESALAILEQ